MAINLIPWREKMWAKQRHLRQMSLILVMILTISAFLLWWYILKSKSAQLEKKVLMVEEKLGFSQQQEVQNKFIKKLVERNKELLQLLETIPQVVPERLKIIEFGLKNDNVLLSGETLNKSEIIQFHSDLQKRIKPSACSIKELNFNKNDKHYQFEFNIELK